MTKVFYDLMPDNSVSVYVFGDWDYFKSFRNLISFCDYELGHYELVDITDTTLQERLEIMEGYV